MFFEIFRDICLPILILMSLGWVIDRKFNLNLDECGEDFDAVDG